MNHSGPFDPSYNDNEFANSKNAHRSDRKPAQNSSKDSEKSASKLTISTATNDKNLPSEEPPVSSRARMLAQQRDSELKRRQTNKSLTVSTYNGNDPFADIAGMASPKPILSSHKTPTVSQFSAPRVEERSPESDRSSEFHPYTYDSGKQSENSMVGRNRSDMLEFEAQEKPEKAKPTQPPKSMAPTTRPPVRDQANRIRRDNESNSQGSNEADENSTGNDPADDEDDNYGNLAVTLTQQQDELDLNDNIQHPAARKQTDVRSISIPQRPRNDRGKEDDGATEKGTPSVGQESLTQDEMFDFRNMRKFLMSPILARAGVVQCFIVRNKSGPSKVYPEYKIYLKSSRRFLMCARKRPNNKTSNYILSMGEDDFDRNSINYLGKLRSNFFGTEFQLYDHGINPNDADDSKDNSIGHVRQELGAVCYATNLLGAKGPRKMQVGLPLVGRDDKAVVWRPFKKEDELISHLKSRDISSIAYLINKPPRWNEHVGAYVLNFNGRVTMASVKNFQLVFPDDQDRVTLQFGRVGKDEFTMDFQWPMSPFQALAITLSSFDSKIACD